MDPRDPVAHHQIESVSFSVYTPEEVRKLSVLEVTNPIAFNQIGHANSKGLADLAMGPVNKGDVCITCTMSNCDGHFGHISLPLPVFNPVFLRTMYQILKTCCFQCHHLLVSPVGIELFIAQLEALDKGLIYILPDLELEVEEHANHLGGQSIIDMSVYIRNKLRERLELEINKAKKFEIEPEQIRNAIEKKQQMVKDFLQGKVFKLPKQGCFYCAAKKSSIVIANNSVIIQNAAKNSHADVKSVKSYLTATEARHHLRELWKNEKEHLHKIFGLLQISSNVPGVEHPTDVFFMETLPVPPNKFRPVRFMNGRQFENEHTAILGEVMGAANVLAATVKKGLSGVDSEKSGNEAAKIHYSWTRLQILTNRLFDTDMDRLPDKKYVGVKQRVEKKQGMFRMFMMGKRVNFAARSVISPDPYIMADEVGIPLVFATKLSYPQPLTNFNYNQMRQAILNGPNVHPGALSVQLGNQVCRLKAEDPTQRLMIADRMLSIFNSRRPVIINRHLITGDVLLLNRQPTLHKPSIMAHRARVLPREKTLRMHYANCKCYNADFDGDEMNAHFPQSELARAEAYQIASVNQQYLVPKDGTPLSGLIQDHIVSATMLSLRGVFLSREDFIELVYGAISFTDEPVEIPGPAILKPRPLYTGKQVISTLVLNLIPKGKPPPSVTIASKVKPKSFVQVKPRTFARGCVPLKEDEMCESVTVFRHGELLCGIIDKASIGPTHFGLIHVCYELYGGAVSTALLTAFARLATNYLQNHSGLTLGIHDILVKKDANKKRRKAMKRAENVGMLAVSEALGIETDEFSDELKIEKMREAHVHKDPIYMKQLDHSFKVQTDRINNDISQACLGDGLVKQFPANNLQLMIQAGAKGGTVNALQISCLLGQIELEGRRPPLMMSGKSLPSFTPYNSTPRAGGFIAGRFLTGIRPQEFFFHCMAGREGLIDTAVKTSRSGYLQRCLIKHLESLVVSYDLTVRDSDGSVIQYQYGEDGLDILKSQLLNKKALPTVIANAKALTPTEEEQKHLQRSTETEKIEAHREEIKEWETINKGQSRLRSVRGSAFLDYFREEIAKHEIPENEELSRQISSNICNSWFALKRSKKQKYYKHWKPCPDPLPHLFQPKRNFGVLTEKLENLIENYVQSNPDNLIKAKRKNDDQNNNSRPLLDTTNQIRAKNLTNVIGARFIKALCDPGEAVGLVAAQSIGEPSTQMTLNTFHFAGRGEMNVTLGIPRLREILMTASPNISTPSMDLPLRADLGPDAEKRAEQIRLMLNSVRLADVLQNVTINESLHIDEGLGKRRYEIVFTFLPQKYYKKKYNVNGSKVLRYFEGKFVSRLMVVIDKKMRTLFKMNSLFDHAIKAERVKQSVPMPNDDDTYAGDMEEERAEAKSSKQRAMKAFEDDDEASSEEEVENEGDTTDKKSRDRHNQDLDYEEPEEIEIEDAASDNEADAEVNDNEEALVIVEPNEDEEDDQQAADKSIQLNTSRSEKKLRQKKMLEKQKETRIAQVKSYSAEIENYDFDTEKERWCKLLLCYDISGSKFDLASIVQAEARKAFVYKVGNIDRAFLVKDNAAKTVGYDKMVKTEGVSFLEMVEYGDVLDLNRMYSNDTHAIARTYGIEAAAQALKREISNVFAVYGIQVDPRHLSLISDYMTFGGSIKGMNRMSMSANSSPIQQMTFETTTAFLKTAALMGFRDDLYSPSARIFAGRPACGGTGAVQLIQNPFLKPIKQQPKIKLEREQTEVEYSPRMSRTPADKPNLKRKVPRFSLESTVNKRIKFT